jgi:hypothetical protein
LNRNRGLAAACAASDDPHYVIAARARMNANVLGGIISGRLSPTVDQLTRLADALGVEIEQISPDVAVTS